MSFPRQKSVLVPLSALQKDAPMNLQEAIAQGLKLHKEGQLAQAETFYAAALRTQPDLISVLHLMGMLRFHQQNFTEARKLMEQVLARQPGAPETLYYYGLTLAALDDARAAVGALSRVLETAPPGHPIILQALAGRGDILMRHNFSEPALADFDRLIAANPADVGAWNNRGLVLIALQRHDEALQSFDRALALAPDTVEAHNNRGDTLRELHRYEEALASFERALAIAPRDWASLNNRAIALTFLGRVDEALADYNKALAIDPNIGPALHARSTLLSTYKDDYGPAIADMERLVAVNPDFAFGPGSLMRLKMTAVQWDDFKERKAQLDAGVAADKPVTMPFIYLAVSDKPADILRCARFYSQYQFPAQPPMAKKGTRKPGRIRIGYVCGELRTHATLYLTAGMFEAHDKSAFEITVFSSGNRDDSALRRRFDAAVEKVVDVSNLSDRQAASRVAAEDIDILVDLNGYSGNQRIGIFAYRPAPVQVAYLAYPGTMGAPYIDYAIVDKVVAPPAEEACFSEKLAWLPHSYQVNDDKRVTGPAISRAEAGLPDEGFVFCNFNNTNKYTPASFAIWMRLLANVPGSVLWLMDCNAIARENLQRQAAIRSIDPDRLIFAPFLPFDQHLARLAHADLFVDGQPYGAHTTASDALWAGVPLVTARGTAFAGRVAASLLSALEMPELIAETPDALEALAQGLAKDPQRLKALRKKLAAKRAAAPLFNTGRTTRAIERAYRTMLEQPVAHSFQVPDGD